MPSCRDSAGRKPSRSARSSGRPTHSPPPRSSVASGRRAIVRTLIEGEALFNDATALVAYRAAVLAAVSGSFVLSNALAGFAVAAVGGILIGAAVGRVAGEILRRLDDPPVEVLISVVIPFAAYLPADRLGLSGVLAAVTAGLVIGGRLGTILTPNSRVLWLTSWKMIGFVLNGFVFVLIGLELPRDPREPRRPADRASCSGSPRPCAASSSSRGSCGSSPRASCPGRRDAQIAQTRPAPGHAAHVRRELGRPPGRRLAGGGPRPARPASRSAT